MYIYRAGFEKQKVIYHFLVIAYVLIATHFSKVIRNCESLFAMYLHFVLYT